MFLKGWATAGAAARELRQPRLGQGGVNGWGRGMGIGWTGRSGMIGRWGISTTATSYRLLSGVRWVGTHVEPGEEVGGSRVLSGTVA